MRIARPVGAIETCGRMAHLTDAADGRCHTDKTPIANSETEVEEHHNACAFGRVDLLANERCVTTHVRMVAIETGGAWLRRRLMYCGR